MLPRLLPLLLLFVASCNPCCFGQISLSETKVQVVTGLVAPQVVGESIIIGAESKPQVTTASLIELKAGKEYKNFDIEAENVANYSLAALTKIDDTHWLLSGQGKYRVSALAFDPDLARARLFIELGPTPPPVPPGPVPPTPTPDGEAPIPEPGFRVLIVYETSQLPPRWVADADFSGYLNSHCIKKGATPEWRILDQHVPIAAGMELWGKAMARERKSVPWLLVSNGKTGFEGPLPATKEETLALLAKYAEAK